jgi:hypothetical protein
MSDLTRQQLCAALSISESTVRRLERDGLPCTPVGLRVKRYDLAECKKWLRENQTCPPGLTKPVVVTQASWSAGSDYTESSRSVRRRVMPSPLRLASETQ